jgi:hypothetical protein
MAKFCPECATALEPDARFCPSCRASVSVGGALASELRAGLQGSVRQYVVRPAGEVPKPIWAGVLQVMLVIPALGSVLLLGTMALAGTSVLGAVGPFAGPTGEKVVVWLMAAAFVSMLQVSVQLPLVYGLFALKAWAPRLYLTTIGPILVAGVVIALAMPGETSAVQASPPLGLTIVKWGSYLVWLALVGLQFTLIVSSKDEFSK